MTVTNKPIAIIINISSYCRSLLGEGMLTHKLDSISNSVNLFSDIICNFKSELIFNRHDQFHDI